MNKRNAGRQSAALIILLAGLVIAGSVAAVAAFGGQSPAKPAPSVKPSPVPVVTPAPSEEPSAQPTIEPEPSGPVDAMPITVDLETLTGHTVTIDIVDDQFGVVEAVSGTPTASASVDPYTLQVENIDDRTLRLTWVDRPGDNRSALYIDHDANRFVLVQPEHDTDGDSILHDRVLILTFRDAIDAADIETFLQEGLDTPG